jgi:hypothetical protein
MSIFKFFKKKCKMKMDNGNVYFQFFENKKCKMKMDIGNVYFQFFKKKR